MSPAPDIHEKLQFAALGIFTLCPCGKVTWRLGNWPSSFPGEENHLLVRSGRWAAGSWTPFGRDCCTSRSFSVIPANLKSLFSFSMWKKLVSKSLVFIYFETKYPLATQMKCFHFRRNATLHSTWNDFFFSIQRNQWTKKLVIPSPLLVPRLLSQMALF